MVDSLLSALILTMLSMQFISLQIKDLGLAPILNGVSKAFLEKLELKNWQNQVKGIKVNFKLKDTKINDGLDSGD